MKSYLRFLSRNKLYTAIEVVGLGIALAFVVFIATFVAGELGYDKHLRNTDTLRSLVILKQCRNDTWQSQ